MTTGSLQGTVKDQDGECCRADGHYLLGVHDLRVHVLLPGEEFNLAKRAGIPVSPPGQRGGEAKMW